MELVVRLQKKLPAFVLDSDFRLPSGRLWSSSVLRVRGRLRFCGSLPGWNIRMKGLYVSEKRSL